jgi:integrase
MNKNKKKNKDRKYKGLYMQQGSLQIWCCYTVHGKLIRQSLKTTDWDVAGQRLEKIKADIASGRWYDEERIKKYTFLDLSEKYRVHAESFHKSYFRTGDSIISRLEKRFADVLLSDLNLAVIEQYQAELLKAKKANATVNKYIGALKAMMSKAVDWEMIGEDRLLKVRRAKHLRENERKKYLSLEEIANLLSKCDPHLKPIVQTALFTGMRKGEILGLKWDRNIDLKNDNIHLFAGETKNDEERDIEIVPALKEVLLSLPRFEGVPWVFYDAKSGKRYLDIKKSFATACRLAGLDDFNFHDLRHTFASHLTMAGVPLKAVGEKLGQKTLSMTNRYSHLSPEYSRSIISKLPYLSSSENAVSKVENE